MILEYLVIIWAPTLHAWQDARAQTCGFLDAFQELELEIGTPSTSLQLYNVVGVSIVMISHGGTPKTWMVGGC